MGGSVGVCSLVGLKTLLCLCAVPCLLVEGVFFCVVCRYGLLRYCSCASVCLSSSPIVLLFLFFYCLVCVHFPRQRCLLSSPVPSLRSFVRPMYDLSIVCNTTINSSQDDLQCRNMCGLTDRQLSCKQSR